MHIITTRRIKEFAQHHPDAQASLATWVRIAEGQRWQHIHEVRASWPSADAAGHLTVFNIGGNRYRLIVYIGYTYQKIFVRSLLTHADYDKEGWKNDPWF